MKKIMICLAIGLSIASVPVFAQAGNDAQKVKMQQMMRQRLKDSLQLSDAMADSVMAVRQEFQPQMRTIFMDQSLSPDQKQTKLTELEPQITARYKSIGLTDEQINKLEAMEKKMRDRMRERMNEKNQQ